MHLLFAGNTLKFERLKISSEIKGNFKLDGNVLEIALQLYSALRFDRLKRVQTTKTALTEEFMFQNVAYRPTVYRTGGFTLD